MTIKFFTGVKTYDELRKRYKKLAFENHPDRGGNTETMKAINNEYDFLKEHLEGFNTESKEHINDIEYREIIDKIINFNCDIEIIGTWVWCFRAFEVKDQLKELGFKWASKKKAWVWHSPDDIAKHSNLTLDEIRDLHGSERIKSYKKLYITA